MKHGVAVLFGLLFLHVCPFISMAAEVDVKGSTDHPLLARMPNFYISSYQQVEFGSHRFVDQDKKGVTKEGRKKIIEYRLMKDSVKPGELKIRRNLQSASMKIGGRVVFDDNFNRCSTIVLPQGGLETWVDVRAYDSMYRLTIVEQETIGQEVRSIPATMATAVAPARLPDVPSHLPGQVPLEQNPWPQWVIAAKKGVRSGLPLWISQTGLTGGIITGARVSGGSLTGPPALLTLMSVNMKIEGVPDHIVNGFMGPLTDGLNTWASNARVPDLPWYPKFEVFPGPVAPPTPSPQFPLSSLVMLTTYLEPSVLGNTISARLGKDAMSPQAQAAIKEFCDWFHSGFRFWLYSATIKEVIGTGPVPTYNPDANILFGPVISGTANGGTISPLPSWP